MLLLESEDGDSEGGGAKVERRQRTALVVDEHEVVAEVWVSSGRAPGA